MPGALIALALLFVVTTASAAELHVAPGGSDANPGTRARPLATLAGARDAVRAGKLKGVTVTIHGGTYQIGASFVLDARDNGTVYRSAPGEEVRLVGGRTLPPAAFVPVTDPEALARIDEAARPHVLVADLKALGLAGLVPPADPFANPSAARELFFDDRRMTLARWPNEGWATISRVVESGPAPWRNHESTATGTFEYAGDRPSRWIHAPAVWLEGYWCFDWCNATIKVGKIDPEQHRITLAAPHVYGIGSGNPAPRRWIAINLLEELDSPGEYFIDRERAALYFWPPKPVAGARIALSTLPEPVIDVKDASGVTLRGLIVECCVGVGMRVTGGRNVRIEACTVRNVGQNGIVVAGGRRHKVLACDIYDTGAAGLSIGGGDRKTLTPCGHEAIDCRIWNVARLQRTAAYNVHIHGVGVRLAHCLLHDSPHQGIGLGGNDHVIEYCEIHHIGLQSDDCGAFYMGRNPSERGNVIRWNYWHDVGSSFAHGSAAIYFDDGTSGQRVYGNVFVRASGGKPGNTPFGAVFCHGGFDNVAENNIFVDCPRALGSAPWSDKSWREWLDGDTWHEHLLKEVDITKPPYTARYPHLIGFIENSDKRPRRERADRNVMVRCGSVSNGNWDVTATLQCDDDPGFVDAAQGNYALRADSRVFRDLPGFQPIPFERIGPHRNRPTSRPNKINPVHPVHPV
jgi:hypothetical protein